LQRAGASVFVHAPALLGGVLRTFDTSVLLTSQHHQPYLGAAFQ
jgi:hypothetical protein